MLANGGLGVRGLGMPGTDIHQACVYVLCGVAAQALGSPTELVSPPGLALLGTLLQVTIDLRKA